MRHLAHIVLLLAAGACGPAPRVGAPQQTSRTLTPTLSSIQERILTPSCATSSCHSGSPPPNAPVSLDALRAYDDVVGVRSSQAPLQLVNPGAPEASYLLLKLKGSAGSAGGISTVMPIGAPPLTAEQIEAIETWITNGAPND